jgi:hypothetical protein
MRNLKVETRLNMMVGVMSVSEIIIIIMIIKLWISSHIAKETWIWKSKMMKKNEEITSRIGMNLKFRGRNFIRREECKPSVIIFLGI